MQIICICPDICAFSVLDNRHCADICTICQKCQFEVERADKYCCFSQRLMTCIVTQQTLPYWNFHWSKLQWNKYILSQNRLMWWLLSFVVAWAMSHLRAFCHESHFVANTRFLGLFCADFYADIWDLTQILRRYLDKNRRLRALVWTAKKGCSVLTYNPAKMGG